MMPVLSYHVTRSISQLPALAEWEASPAQAYLLALILD